MAANSGLVYGYALRGARQQRGNDMTANKPATPLPWSAELIGLSEMGPNGVDVFDIGPCDKDGAMRVRVATAVDDDAAYIVHACNAYPELVAALRNFIGPQIGRTYSQTMKEGKDILRKLGEGA